MNDRIRAVLASHGKLSVSSSTIGEDADLYSAGLTSHASVNVMLALEDEFDVEFPDSMLRKATFASISNLSDALRQLIAEAA